MSLDLEQLKKVLTGADRADPAMSVPWRPQTAYDPFVRSAGGDWPATALTMVGLTRLDQLQRCIEVVLADKVPGDFIETGVWRGGACMFMRAVLKAHDVTDRQVWVADSFAGLPAIGPDGDPYDAQLRNTFDFSELAVQLDEVRANFREAGLLDEQVQFLPGWFKDTLPPAPIEKLAVLRLDGDFYSSTMDALVPLYPKLSPGGFVIIDDYKFASCQRAVHEYRARNGITERIDWIDWAAAGWRKGTNT